MRFDHLMHWVPDLERAIAACDALGYPVRRGGRHPMGTHNAVWRAGDGTYTELIAVHDWDTFREARGADASESLGRLLETGGGAGAIAFEVDDAAATAEALRSRGVEVSGPREGGIERPDGSRASWHLVGVRPAPPAGPAWQPFFIQYGMPRRERLAAMAARAPLGEWRFARLVVETADPPNGAAWLARIMGLEPVGPVGKEEAAVEPEGCRIEFVRGGAERVTRVVLAGRDAPAGVLANVSYERAAG